MALRLPQLTNFNTRDAVRTPSLGSRLGAGLSAAGSSLPTFRSSPGFDLAKTAMGSNPFGDLNRGIFGTSGYDAIAGYFGQLGGALGGAIGNAFTNTGAIASGNLANAQSYINQSASRWGVPANLLAAFIARESTGRWDRDGTRYVRLPDRGHGILPYAGLTDPAIRRVGETTSRLMDGYNDQAEQIDAAAELIRLIYENEGRGDWRSTINVYYSGDPSGRTTPSDSYQYGTTNSYARDVMNFWQRLEGGPLPTGGPSGAAGLGASLGGSLDSLFGGQPIRITQEFGLTDFARNHIQPGGMYHYSYAYGGEGHVGLDIGQNPDTPTYSPVSGTVITSGGTRYYTDSRYGAYHPTSGELKIKLDNGDEVILGHMGRIDVRVGDRVSAGQMVGLSGTNNGGHIHLEYRQYTPGATSSGYTAIDPRQALAGMGGGFPTFGQQQDLSSFGTGFDDPVRLFWDSGLRSSLLSQ